MNNTHLLNFAIDTAKGAGNIIKEHFGNIKSIDRKSTNIDLLTVADTESEAFILKKSLLLRVLEYFLQSM